MRLSIILVTNHQHVIHILKSESRNAACSFVSKMTRKFFTVMKWNGVKKYVQWTSLPNPHLIESAACYKFP